jgi:hypothetical protein
MKFLRKSTASQSRILGPFLDDTDFKTAETALTIANTDIKLMSNGGASANKNSGGGTHRVNGEYSITFDATDTATVGTLRVSCVVAGALPVFDNYWVLEAAVYDAIFAASALGYVANAPVSVAQWNGTNVEAPTTAGRPNVTVAASSDKTAPGPGPVLIARYGAAAEFYVAIGKAKTSDLAVGADWTPAAGDVKISKDGGAAANIGTLPSAVTMGNTAYWKFVFTAAELTAARVMVTVGDAATKAVQDCAFSVLTHGHPLSGLAFLGAAQICTATGASTTGVAIANDTNLDPAAMSAMVYNTGGAKLENRLVDSFNAGTATATFIEPLSNTPSGTATAAFYAVGAGAVADPATAADVTAASDKVDALQATVDGGVTLDTAYDFAKGTAQMTESFPDVGDELTPVQALTVIAQFLTNRSFDVTSGVLTIGNLSGAPAMTFQANSTRTALVRLT